MGHGGTDWAAWAAFGAPILLGGLGMAWRLGRLEQRVSDLVERVRELSTAVARRRP